MADTKRYTVTIDMYIDAENDYMARRKAHIIKRTISSFNTPNLENEQTAVIGITEKEKQNPFMMSIQEE